MCKYFTEIDCKALGVYDLPPPEVMHDILTICSIFSLVTYLLVAVVLKIRNDHVDQQIADDEIEAASWYEELKRKAAETEKQKLLEGMK